MTGRSYTLLLLAALCVPVTPGCGGADLVPLSINAAVTGVARVKLQQIDGNVMTFTVFNDSNEPITINRSAIFLVGPHGDRRTILDAYKGTSTVARNASQDVPIRFSLEKLGPGDDVQIIFADALTVHGRPVAMPAIRLEMAY